MSSDLESKLVTLIFQLVDVERYMFRERKMFRLFTKIVTLVRSIDLDSQPKPESKIMSLVTQTMSLFDSMDLDSLPKPLSERLSVVLTPPRVNSAKFYTEFKFSLRKALDHQPEPEFMSLIRQIILLAISMEIKWSHICLNPKVEVTLNEGKFSVKEISWRSYNKWKCIDFYMNSEMRRLGKGKEETHFRCIHCNGENHEEYKKTPDEIKHPLHPKHPLQLVRWFSLEDYRECHCCDEGLKEYFYYCSACDFAVNIACMEEPPVLSIDRPKWHEHTLDLFSRTTSLTCDVCALADSRFAFYICPPCGFVVHRRCMNLPRVIRISRHFHRISFTSSFVQGDWSCGVCRRKVDNDYGGYTCTKDGCSYATHSRCATQKNVWDGIDLEGVPEEDIGEVEPFVKISDGIIKHFSHEEHHLRLDDEDKGRDYDENKLCQACITPIYFGNFYSCMQCDFVLHETCANISRKIYHPIHPHLLTLTLVGGNTKVVNYEYDCAACSELITAGFFYVCGEERCRFKLHVQCATISEPLLHGSHMHPLFLTSKPGEERKCSVCQGSEFCNTRETFNCIECDCEFSLCFKCAAIPEKVRYKHDKHILTLSYGEKTSQETYWCEACERKINPKKRFYKCDEYCCVTLHIECLIGKDLYMKSGSSWFKDSSKATVVQNNQHMSRPICCHCGKRCPYKIVFQSSVEQVFCSVNCFSRIYIEKQ